MQLKHAVPSPCPTSLSSDSSILIIGSGTWGSSTALHLARRGYTNVTVLDPHPCPSPLAAGNDINKVLALTPTGASGSLERYVSHKLANEALHGWKTDPVFSSLYHETGIILAASTEKGRAALAAGDSHSKNDGWIPLRGKHDFRRTMPDGILTGDFPGWTGYWKQSGFGWVEADKALQRVVREAKRLGVVFITGERGRVKSLIYEGSDVRGAVVASGPPFKSDRTILCAGANTALLLDMKDQLRPTAWTLANIQLSPSEAKIFQNIPVLFNIERGYFIEPDTEGNLKVGDEYPGYCNWETNPDTSRTRQNSVPFSCDQIPVEAERRIRKLLGEMMPHLADRPFSSAHLCWDADTPDRAFLISKHPEYPSLTVASGGSGLGFVYIPIVGAIIADCMEGKMDHRAQKRFEWRPKTAIHRDWTDVQGRLGAPGSSCVMDLQKVEGWTDIKY